MAMMAGRLVTPQLWQYARPVCGLVVLLHAAELLTHATAAEVALWDMDDAREGANQTSSALADSLQRPGAKVNAAASNDSVAAEPEFNEMVGPALYAEAKMAGWTCEPFDLVSRHMLGGADADKCFASGIGAVARTQCNRTLKAIGDKTVGSDYRLGEPVPLICAPGYEGMDEPKSSKWPLTCIKGEQWAYTSLICVPVAAKSTGTDTAVADDSSRTGETEGYLTSDAMTSTLALGGWACVVCLLGATVASRRQKRAADT